MKYVELRSWSSDGTTPTILPHYGVASISDVFCDAGFGSFSYPIDDFTDGVGRTFSGANTLGLTYNSEISCLVDGTEVLRFFIETVSNPYLQDGKMVRTLSGRSTLAYTEDAIVYPSAWPSTIPAGHAFVDATPGNIMRTLIARWKGRYGGGLRVNETSFTGTTTTDGVAWTKILTINYTNGYSYLQVLQDLRDQGLCEFEMVGRTLNIYNQGKISGVHRSTLLMQRGKNALEAEGDIDTKDVGTAVLVEGDNYVALSLPDTGAIDGYRRREKYVSVGGITDSGTLNLIGTATLASSKVIPEQVSIGVTANDQQVDPVTGKVLVYADPQPWTDYNPGEWVKVDRTGTIEELQVQQITLDVDVNRKITVGVTVGTLIDDNDLRLQRKIAAITGGNSGSYGPLPNPNQNDRIAPASPSTVSVSSTGYVNAAGTPYSQVTISWPAVVTNSDGTFCDDLDHYEVQEKLGSNDWGVTGTIPGDTLVTYDSGMPPGSHFLARVRAVDSTGNASPWTTSSDTVLANVTTPPPTPSLPILTNSVGSLYATWDGNDSTGHTMATPSYRFVEVHVATSGPTFTLSATTLRGQLNGNGVVRIQPITYGTTYYVRYRTVDFVQNFSTATTAVSIIPGAVQTGDLGNAAVTAAILAANSVTTTAIADGSISTPKIVVGAITAGTIAVGAVTAGAIAAGSVTSDKIIAGAVTADKLAATMILGSTIIAGTATGSRVQLDATGINAYDPDGNNTVNIGSDGSAMFTGAQVSANFFDAQILQIDAGDQGGIFQYGSSSAALNSNSSFSVGISGWNGISGSTISYSPNHTYNSHNTLRVVRTGGPATVASDAAPVTAGSQYQVTATVLSSDTTPIRLAIRWLNSSGTEIGHVWGSPGPGTTAIWSTITVAGAAPVGATQAVIWVAFAAQDDAGAFYVGYAAVKGTNVISSWASSAGTDQYGNTYPAGLNVTLGAVGVLTAGNIKWGRTAAGQQTTGGIVTITHGCNGTPNCVTATMTRSAGLQWKPVIDNITATTFQVKFVDTTTATITSLGGQTVPFSWFAAV